jgi:hypothetical protein
LKKDGTWQVFVFVLEKEEKVVKICFKTDICSPFYSLFYFMPPPHQYIRCCVPYPANHTIMDRNIQAINPGSPNPHPVSRTWMINPRRRVRCMDNRQFLFLLKISLQIFTKEK